MIQSAFYNGINFSGDFARTNELINFNAQRVKMPLNRMVNIKYLSFLYSGDEPELIQLEAFGNLGTQFYFPENAPIEIEPSKWLIYFEVFEDTLGTDGSDVYFKLTVGDDVIFSEIYEVQSPAYFATNNIKYLTATNNDNRHGFLENQAFGFFETVGFNEDFFVNDKTEYEYSYSRKKILSSENNIGKRLTFKNLTKYNQILLKWLANCENFYIDGIQYQLVSDFSELLNDENTEIMDLRADFIKSEQSFFATGSEIAPTNVFTRNFFIK
jgi:hypothetical protein